MPHIEFTPEHVTARAVSFRAERVDPETGTRGSQTVVWLPKSQLNWTERGDTWLVQVPTWLYEEKGLAMLAPVEPLSDRG